MLPRPKIAEHESPQSPQPPQPPPHSLRPDRPISHESSRGGGCPLLSTYNTGMERSLALSFCPGCRFESSSRLSHTSPFGRLDISTHRLHPFHPTRLHSSAYPAGLIIPPIAERRMPHLRPIITQLSSSLSRSLGRSLLNPELALAPIPARSVQVRRTLSSLSLPLSPRRLVEKRHFTVMSYNLKPDGSVEYIGKNIPRKALPPDVNVAQGSECTCDNLTVTRCRSRCHVHVHVHVRGRSESDGSAARTCYSRDDPAR